MFAVKRLHASLSIALAAAALATPVPLAAAPATPLPMATAESFGLPGYGYHSSEEEYVDLDGVEPRLYLLTRLIMDTARGR
jgi:hypothetical protein